MTAFLFGSVTVSAATRNCWLGVLVVFLFCFTVFIPVSSCAAADEANDTEPRVRRVGEYVVPTNLRHVKLEAIGLVTGLGGTGSDPPPSSRRGVLTAEMQARDVRDLNQILASQNTSLALVRGYLPPAVEKGEQFDIEIRVSSRSSTISLEGGWLMKSRLKEMAVLGNRIHEGHMLALAEGPVLINAMFDGKDDDVSFVRGRVLGGGVALKTFPLGLTVREGKASVQVTQLVGAAINRRFHSIHGGANKGIATPKTDEYVELRIHPRYKRNLTRYLRVIQAIPIRLSGTARIAQMQHLEGKLMTASTSNKAAIGLEALGSETSEILAKGLNATDSAVRFYSAEALAYLNDERAAAPLAEAARHKSKYRWNALTALTVMDDITAYDELSEMLHDPSAETRYGAFRALRDRNPNDPLIQSTATGNTFHCHLIATHGDPLIHFARRGRPEIVVFGNNLQLKMPLLLFAGQRLIVDGREGNTIKVTRFSSGEDDRHEYCPPNVGDVIRSIAKVGGSYPDAVGLLYNAKSEGYLDARIAFDAVAFPGIHGGPPEDVAEAGESTSPIWSLPPLFDPSPRTNRALHGEFTSTESTDEDDSRLIRPARRFFGRMFSRFRP